MFKSNESILLLVQNKRLSVGALRESTLMRGYETELGVRKTGKFCTAAVGKAKVPAYLTMAG